MIKYFAGFSLLAGLVFFSCSKSTIVGSEILTGDYVDVGYMDTITLKALNMVSDSARIYPATNTLFLLGAVDDPVFGKSSTEVYRQIRKLYETPDLEGAVLDSVVLSLGINPLGYWGDTLAMHEIEIYELGESLIDKDSIYTSQRFEKGALLGTKTLNPYLQDTAVIIISEDTLSFNDIIRIRLDQAFGENLLANPVALQNDTLIQELTNGLVIRSTPTGNSFFGMDNSIFLDDITNKLILYYSQGDTLQSKHVLTLGGKGGMYIENDRTASTVADYLNNEEGSDTLLFISGLRNTGFQMELPYLEGLDDLLINYAEMEFYATTPEGSLPYDKVAQIYALNVDEEGNRSYTRDLNISIVNNLVTYYDGTEKEVEQADGTIIQRYRINFTNELKRRIEEGDTASKILFVPALNTDRAYRSVLYGPGHSQYPAKLKITFTKR